MNVLAAAGAVIASDRGLKRTSALVIFRMPPTAASFLAKA